MARFKVRDIPGGAAAKEPGGAGEPRNADLAGNSAVQGSPAGRSRRKSRAGGSAAEVGAAGGGVAAGVEERLCDVESAGPRGPGVRAE